MKFYSITIVFLGEFECNATLEGHENEVKSVNWSSSGNLLATCSRDKSVWIWEVTGEDEFECGAVLNSHSQDVKRVVWHPTKDILASCSYDDTIKIYAENTLEHDWECTSTLLGHRSTVWAVDFDADGERLVSVSDDCTMKIWRHYTADNPEGIVAVNGQDTWKCICTISGDHKRTIFDVSWCKQTGLIATACGDDAIRIYREDEQSTRNEALFSIDTIQEKAHTQDVNWISWNPNQPKQLLSCSDDGTIKIWKYFASVDD